MKKKLKMLALCALATLVSTSETIWAQNRTDVVVQSGQTVAGGNGIYSTFGNPVLNNSGQTAFLGILTGTSGGALDNQAIFLKGARSTTQVVRKGQSALGNGTYSSFSGLPMLNDSGNVAFNANLIGTSGGTSDNFGIFHKSGSTTRTLVRKGDQFYFGFGLNEYYDITTLGQADKLNENNSVAFQTTLKLAGVFEYAGVMESNQSSGSSYRRLIDTSESATFGNPVVNNSGKAAYLRSENSQQSIVFNGSSVVASNQHPFSGFSAGLSINDSNQVAFKASITPLGGGGERIYVSNTEFARTGQAPPGNNGVFSSFGDPLLNESGQVAFRATLTGTSGGTSDDTGIFRKTSGGGSITQIAREGQASPDGSGTLTSISSARFALNDSGQAAFRTVIGLQSAILTGDGIDLIKVARVGDSFGRSTITGLAFEEKGLNKHGQVAYRATLANGDQAIGLWTPELRWRHGFSSTWDTAGRWTLGLKPASVHDVVINPNSNITVTGPAASTTVRSLQIGGGLGIATLNFPAVINFTASEGIDIRSNGVLRARGTLSGATDNNGTIEVASGDNVFFSGSLIQKGTLRVLPTGQATVQGAFIGNGFVGGGTVFAANELRPGNSTASVLYDGNLTLLGSTDTFIELGGHGLGEYDQLRVTGNLSLAGDLMVSIMNGFRLSLNQKFLIGDVTGNRIGQFVGLGEGSRVGNFGEFDLLISYLGGNGNDITLYTSLARTNTPYLTGDGYAAVPEPSSGLVLGVVLMCGLTRRHRTLLQSKKSEVA